MTKFKGPKHITEMPAIGSFYYVPNLQGDLSTEYMWGEDFKSFKSASNLHHFHDGLCFYSEEDANLASLLMRAALPMYEALDAINKYHNDTSNGKSSKEQEFYAKKVIVFALAKARGEQ